MCSVGLYVTFWPDMFHRFARRCASALNASQGQQILRKLNRVFKMSRGPFATSKFGRSMQEVRMNVARALRKGQALEIAEMWLSGVARDLKMEESDFTIDDLIHHLEKGAGKMMSNTFNYYINLELFRIDI